MYEFKQSKSEIGLGRRAFADASSVADGWSVFLSRCTRAEQSPRVFKTIEMIYHVEGNVPVKLLERIVEKSHEKYCSVSNMLTEVKMSSRVVVHEPKQ